MAVVCVLAGLGTACLPLRAADANVATASAAGFSLGNAWFSAQGKASNGHWAGMEFVDRADGRKVELPEAFSLTFQDGTIIRSSQLPMIRPFSVVPLRADPQAARFSDRVAGRQVCAQMLDGTHEMWVDWCGILRDGSNYFRQQISVHATERALPITQVRLLDFQDTQAHVAGSVKGSPITDVTFFFGLEHPLSMSRVEGAHAEAWLPRVLPIQPGQSFTCSAVLGVAAPDQMRRAFLRYIERERAHPYRPFLQYNSWYDLSFNTRYSEAGALDRIHAFGDELVKKRGVTISSFVFDDGWDNTNSLWGFDSGFPNGFRKAADIAAQYNTHIGLWLSPWGGYHEQKQQRVAFGEKLGYEVVNNGFALSGPKYYAAFQKICLDMIRNYGANEFKFDGTGNADRVFPGSAFDSDFDAMLSLIQRLRQTEPDIFINLTTGTYPSPFWLFSSDAIWRGGDDHNFAGVGSSRQRWITYRDAQVYRYVVQGGPLFPLNSLMQHGIIYASLAQGLQGDDVDFRDEVESFFGSGTQVQEMYITPSLLTQADWDTLAAGAKWASHNAETLKDVHWIGGDPAKLEVYGWAAWSPQKAIVTLRNPSDKPQDFTFDPGQALELPAGAARTYAARDPWNDGAKSHPLRMQAGRKITLHLQPWEVRTLEGAPAR